MATILYSFQSAGLMSAWISSAVADGAGDFDLEVLGFGLAASSLGSVDHHLFTALGEDAAALFLIEDSGVGLAALRCPPGSRRRRNTRASRSCCGTARRSCRSLRRPSLSTILYLKVSSKSPTCRPPDEEGVFFDQCSVVVWPVMQPSWTLQKSVRPFQPVRSLPLKMLLFPARTAGGGEEGEGDEREEFHGCR